MPKDKPALYFLRQSGPPALPVQSWIVRIKDEISGTVPKKQEMKRPAPEGASGFEEHSVSLKRYPDTKPEFFRNY
jgi:hypothetical protein